MRCHMCGAGGDANVAAFGLWCLARRCRIERFKQAKDVGAWVGGWPTAIVIQGAGGVTGTGKLLRVDMLCFVASRWRRLPKGPAPRGCAWTSAT